MKKIVQFKLLAIVFAIFFIGVAYAQDTKTVYFVHDPGRDPDPATGVHPDLVVANAIEEALGYEIVMWPVVQIETLTEDSLELLKSADLIIIGRAIASGNWTADGREIWNTVEAPVLSTNPWAIRGAQLAWFAGTSEFISAPDEQIMATVMFPDDPIFEGIDLGDEDELHIWTGRANVMQVASEFPGDGDILLQRVVNEGANIQVILARFEGGVPFHEGGVTPAGPRTYMGLGDDAGTDPVVTYWGWSEAGATIFLREVERLATLGDDPGTNVIETEKLSVSVYPNPATDNLVVKMNNLNKAEIWDLTGKLVFSVNGSGHELNIDISRLNAGLYFVKAIDNNNNSVVRRVVKN